MAHSEHTTRSRLLTFIGAFGALLIFALLLLIAYIPNRPAAVDAQINANRKAKAAESIAQGKATPSLTRISSRCEFRSSAPCW